MEGKDWHTHGTKWAIVQQAMFDCQRVENLNDGPIFTGNSGNLCILG